MIELRGVTKKYGDNVTALRDVDLTIDAGEFTAIVGPSGSGKSTMLHIIGALEPPTAGTVRIAGHEVGRLTDDQVSALRASALGFVFQQFHLAPSRTVLDNVADGLLYSGMPRAERRERARLAVERVGLANRLHHMPHQLSGGQQQRVAIARAVAGEPPILLADEPTGNLDSTSGEVVLGILTELHAAGTTVVVITHDREIADRMERSILVKDGQVAA